MNTTIYNSLGMLMIAAALPDTESEFYKALAKILVRMPEGFYNVSTDNGRSDYEIRLRSGTKAIFSKNHNIYFEKHDSYPTVYLTCIDPVINAYKYYKLEEKNGIILATYGRIGKTKGELFGEREFQYPLDMYWIKYAEKVDKGYTDQTELYLDEDKTGIEKTEEIPKEKSNEPLFSRSLFGELLAYAKNLVNNSINLKEVPSGKITPGMVKEARRLLHELYKTNTVEDFNRILLKLLTVSPRNVLIVQMLLARDSADFKTILEREENLVNAMEGLILDGNVSNTKSKIPDTGFSELNIQVNETTLKEAELVKKMLDPKLAGKVKAIYKITNNKHETRFKEYCKKRNISNTRFLWHGSRNENWLSIINKGLLLNPNAVITGKMFGNGIYFAPKSTKSWGYTSYRNAYWTSGSCDTAFMGVYETAYGNPLNVVSAKRYTQDTLQGKDCVHAHAGHALMNDEIIFYDESAMVLRYIVKFS